MVLDLLVGDWLYPYTNSHLVGEHAVLTANSREEFQGIVLHLSITFGRPMNKDVNCWMLLVNDLCGQAVQAHKLVLQSSGLQHRDFIGLTEVCCVVEKLIDSDQLKQSNLFNVGAGVSKSVLAMAQLIRQRCTKVLGFTPVLQYKKSSIDEQSATLTYHTDNLSALGIICKSQIKTVEIDKLLQFCQMSFIHKNSLEHE